MGRHSGGRRAALHRCEALCGGRHSDGALWGRSPSLVEANGHRADEKLVLEDLRKATGVVALTLAELLGAKLDRA